MATRLKGNMADLENIVQELSKLTVIEAAELVKKLETAWGVSAAAPAAATATGAAALTPHFVSSCFTSAAVSMTVSLLSSSTMFAMSAMLPFSLVVVRGHGRIKLTAREPTIYSVVVGLLPAPPVSRRAEIFFKFSVRQAPLSTRAWSTRAS